MNKCFFCKNYIWFWQDSQVLMTSPAHTKCHHDHCRKYVQGLFEKYKAEPTPQNGEVYDFALKEFCEIQKFYHQHGLI